MHLISARSRNVPVLHLAIALRRLDIPPRKCYAWEDEKDEYEDK